MQKPGVVIVTPALADANNGNWQTAQRWQQLLSQAYKVRLVQQWPDTAASEQDAALLALHARRSAASVSAWATAHGAACDAPGLAVVLTGTDLYRDIQRDPAAQQSLVLAKRLVVLQERGPDELAAALRPKTRVIFQSTAARPTLVKPASQLRAVMVGHLRDEKSPQTLFAAARLLRDEQQIFIDHIGEALQPSLGDEARATAAACPQYRWLGGLSHEDTRRRIQRAHVLVHTSRIEGGAHVIMEALCSGTPVLASRIPGNQGMLGEDYAGFFDAGDAEALAGLLRRCRQGQASLSPATGPGSAQEPLHDDWLARLNAQCAQRAHLFTPDAERAALLQLITELVEA